MKAPERCRTGKHEARRCSAAAISAALAQRWPRRCGQAGYGNTISPFLFAVELSDEALDREPEGGGNFSHGFVSASDRW